MPRWKRTLYVMFVAEFLSAIGFSTIFPFLPLVVESLGSTTGMSVEFWAGAVFSVQGFTMMITAPIWGALADRYGRKLMVQRAMFGGALIILLMAFARSAEELVLLRAIQGAVTGVIAASNALVASTAPREHAGYALGLLQMGLWSGVAIGPLIGGVIADLVGYDMAFMVTAALLFAGGVLVLFGVKEEFKPAQETAGRIRFFSEWNKVVSAPGVAAVFLIRFMCWLGRNIFIPFAPLLVAALMTGSGGIGTMTGLIIGGASAAGTLSAVYLGGLGDRIGHRRVLVVSSVVAALFYLPQGFVTAAWQLIALQALTGAAIGGIMPSLSALLSLYTQPGEEGATYGLDNSIVAGARAVAPLVGSGVVFVTGIYLADAFPADARIVGYRATFVVTGVMFLLTAFVAAWRLPDTRPGQRLVAATGD